MTKPAQLPKGIQKFNWGALLLGLIWGIFNRVWFTLWIIPIQILGYVPILLGISFEGAGAIALPLFFLFYYVLPIGFAVYLGFNGNKLAWQAKKWQSVEQFHKTQLLWAKGAFIAYAVFAILTIIGMVVAIQNDSQSLDAYSDSYEMEAY